MGSGFSKMKKQAKMMQQQMDKMKEQMQKIEVMGQAGGGLVKIKMNGQKEVKNISISPECVDPNDIDGLTDLLISAFNEASKEIDEKSNDNSLPFGL
jgi:nucleoid-associated protein EbfC